MVGRDGRGDAGNSLKIERRQIEGKCGRTIATEPRASDGPAGVVITTLSASLSPLLLSSLPFSCPSRATLLLRARGGSPSLPLKIEVGLARLGETAFPSLTETQDGQ